MVVWALIVVTHLHLPRYNVRLIAPLVPCLRLRYGILFGLLILLLVTVSTVGLPFHTFCCSYPHGRSTWLPYDTGLLV